MDSFLLQATIYLGAAVIAVPLAARLGLGSVFGSVCGNQDREKEIKKGIDETGYHSSIYVHS